MIKDMIEPGENLIWEGKPDKVAYIIGSPVQYLIALLMTAGYALIVYLSKTLENSYSGFNIGSAIIIILIIFVFMPIYRAINWKYVQYIITDKRIYLASGIIGRDIAALDYTAISSPDVNVGLIDKLRNCGSVRLNPKNTGVRANLSHIPDPYNVYKMLKQMSLDIKADIYYPNIMRPGENNGYNTKYTSKS